MHETALSEIDFEILCLRTALAIVQKPEIRSRYCICRMVKMIESCLKYGVIVMSDFKRDTPLPQPDILLPNQ